VNLFVATFTVAQGEKYTEDMPLPTDPQTANASQSICFGDCPQQQGACWPTSGRITTVPYDQSVSTHADTDAFDIATPTGTPVFSPFDGTITLFSDYRGVGTYRCTPPNCTNDAFGISVLIIPNSTEFVGRRFLFAHLTSVSEVVATGNVKFGDEIGFVGSTGNSTGPHLHYQLLDDDGQPSDLMSIVPGGQGSPGVQKFDNATQVCGQ
jgi:murein DD-endopeptidase MepM/ murein hydrolase activator NlpD